eukprot:448566-Pelagomonas_calceolata.AAC.4
MELRHVDVDDDESDDGAIRTLQLMVLMAWHKLYVVQKVQHLPGPYVLCCYCRTVFNTHIAIYYNLTSSALARPLCDTLLPCPEEKPRSPEDQKRRMPRRASKVACDF